MAEDGSEVKQGGRFHFHIGDAVFARTESAQSVEHLILCCALPDLSALWSVEATCRICDAFFHAGGDKPLTNCFVGVKGEQFWKPVAVGELLQRYVQSICCSLRVEVMQTVHGAGSCAHQQAVDPQIFLQGA